MIGLILATLITAGDITWHEDAPGKYRIGLSGGIDDRATPAADRKAMLAGLEPWVAFFKKSLTPKGLDVLINKGARGGSKLPDGPWFQNVDVMLFKYTSSPRWGNKVIPEDETGLTLHLNINSVHRLADVLYRVGETEKGGAMFLTPLGGTRQGFAEYVITPTERTLVLTPPGFPLFLPVTRRELYVTLKQQYQQQLEGLQKAKTALGDAAAKRHQDMQAKFEADHAGLSAADLDAPAVAAPGVTTVWSGLQPKRPQAVVKYNPKFFKTRTKRTDPHFAVVNWKCSHLQPEDLPWMEALVDRLQWGELAKLLAP